MEKFATDFPLAYRIDIQQGTVIDQSMVDQLRPGMDKRQVRFVMGTPLLVDVFHDERWDYFYSMKEGRDDAQVLRVSLYFEDDGLTRVSGDFKPNPVSAEELAQRDALVVVPILPEEKKSLFARIFSKLGFADEDDL